MGVAKRREDRRLMMFEDVHSRWKERPPAATEQA